MRMIALPRLTSVPVLQRIYAGSTVQQKHAVFGTFAWRRACVGSRHHKPARRRGITLANFHLDTAGYNVHRVAQMDALARAISGVPRRHRWPVVACGDTNAFDFRPAEAERDLVRILEPLRRRHAATDAHAACPAPTHFFARAREPKLSHRIAVAVGKLGVDFPRRYDVVTAAASRCVAAGTVAMPDSDHDLAWATLQFADSRTGRG